MLSTNFYLFRRLHRQEVESLPWAKPPVGPIRSPSDSLHDADEGSDPSPAAVEKTPASGDSPRVPLYVQTAAASARRKWAADGAAGDAADGGVRPGPVNRKQTAVHLLLGCALRRFPAFSSDQSFPVKALLGVTMAVLHHLLLHTYFFCAFAVSARTWEVSWVIYERFLLMVSALGGLGSFLPEPSGRCQVGAPRMV